MMIAFSGAISQDELAHLMLLVGIEAVGRFVQHQHVGVVQQRLRQPDPAAVALGESVDRLFQYVCERQPVGRLVTAPGHLGAGVAAHPGDEIEEAFRGHVAVGGSAFRQVAQVGLGAQRVAPDVGAADERGARRRRQEAGDHLHRRRLAGAVRPQEPQHLAPRDGEGDAVDRGEGAEATGEAACFDHRFHGILYRRSRPDQGTGE